MRILFGSEDISLYVTSYVRTEEVVDSRLFGLTPCAQIELGLNNESGYFDNIDVEKEFAIFENDTTLTGKFHVYEKPEKWTKSIQLVLFDKMAKMNICYKTQLVYPTTILKQLLEMSSMTSVGINHQSLNITAQIVNWYDDTVSIRDYLGWIAELDNKNAIVNKDGMIDFVDVKAIPEIQFDSVYDYKKDDPITITRFCFDNGILKLEDGDESGSTVYLSTDNSYIDSNHSLSGLFDKYGGMIIYPVENVKIPFDNRIRTMSHIQVGSLFNFIVTKLVFKYTGGDAPKMELEGAFKSKNEELVTNRYNNDIRIKRLKVELNQIDTSLKITAEKTENNESKLSSLQINVDSINLNVSGVVKDVAEINNQKMYRVEIMSSNGNIFKNGAIDTELRAVLYSWDKNITDEFDASRFRWTRISNDIEEDKAWNTSHFSGTKSIHVTSDDVKARATFQVDVLDSQGKSLIN